MNQNGIQLTGYKYQGNNLLSENVFRYRNLLENWEIIDTFFRLRLNFLETEMKDKVFVYLGWQINKMSFKTHSDKPAEVVRANENAMQIVTSNFEAQYAP